MCPPAEKRPTDDRSRAARLARSQRIEATVFLYDVVATADRLKSARAFDGSTPLRFDRRYDLLRAIERCGGRPSFSDLARLLRVTRQAARQVIVAAQRAGAVELAPHPEDRRVLQVALTPSGRRTLDVGKLPETGWLFILLNGLEPAAVRTTANVLRIIRQRLDDYAAEMGRAVGRNRRERHHE